MFPFAPKANFLRALNSRHDVPARSIASVVPNGASIRIAQVLAAAVVRLKRHAVVRGHKLRQKTELRGAVRPGTAMNDQHERILLLFLKSRRNDASACS